MAVRDPYLKDRDSAAVTTAVALDNGAGGDPILAALAGRRRVKLENPLSNTLTFFILFGAGAVAAQLFSVRLAPGDVWDSFDEGLAPEMAIEGLASGAGPENIMVTVYS